MANPEYLTRDEFHEQGKLLIEETRAELASVERNLVTHFHETMDEECAQKAEAMCRDHFAACLNKFEASINDSLEAMDHRN